MKVPLLDLALQHNPLEQQLLETIQGVVTSNRFIMGPELSAFEEEMAAYCGVRYAVGVSSGTDALLIALMALDVGADDLVITTTYSFFATAGVIARLGARPLFVDINAETYNIDAEALRKTWGKLTQAEKNRVKAIIPVHLYGQCADMASILAFAKQHGIVVVEDAAQAIGAEHPNGKAGSMGQIGCFSFFPSKNLGGFGDGGMVTTGDAALAEKLRILRVHGGKPKYYHHMVGGNFRLDALQAAILRVKLPHLDTWHRQRRENAARYAVLFEGKGLTELITLPASRYEDHSLAFPHIYNQYVISTPQRDALRDHLSSHDVGSAIYYPVPLHRQPCFAYLSYEEGSLPISEHAAQESLAIPIYPGITHDQQAYVVDCIYRFYQEST